MTSIPINQTVEVQWRHPTADGAVGETVSRSFTNLIPACEFAVSIAREGDVMVQLSPSAGGSFDLEQARRIAVAWETGRIPLEAVDVEL